MANKKVIETSIVKKETSSVRTFKAKKNDLYKYIQCDNAYDPKRPYCHNTIKDGDEYLTVICKFDTGDIMRYDYCEGCMRAKLSEEEIEKIRVPKKTQTKTTRIQTLIKEVRNKLEAYDGHDLKGLEAIETTLDEIVRITKGRRHDS